EGLARVTRSAPLRTEDRRKILLDHIGGHRPEVARAYDARRVDEVRRRDALNRPSDVPRLPDAAVPVDDDRELHPELLREVAHLTVVFLQVDGNDDEPVLLVRVVRTDDLGHLLPARSAPRRP